MMQTRRGEKKGKEKEISEKSRMRKMLYEDREEESKTDREKW